MGTNPKALLAAAFAGVVVVGGISMWSAHGGGPRAGCPTVVVTASVEKADLVREIADRYNDSDRTANGQCYGILVNGMASGLAETRLAAATWDPAWGQAPDAWTPAATSWLQLLRHDRAQHDVPDILAADNESVVSTPIVLAMPEPKARALGWPDADIGWSDLLALADDPAGWASKGHPEWGLFKMGKTNPNVSTSGLAATVGAFVAATGTSSDLTLDAVADPRVRGFVAGVEKSVAHYGDTALTFLANLQRADDAGAALGYVSAVAVEEKSIIDYNAGNPTGDLDTAGEHIAPRVPLVAIYPKEGTLNSDSPFAVLQAPWADSGKQAGARDFMAYLREPGAQKVFTDAGFRTYDGEPGSAISGNEHLRSDVGVVLTPPSPPVLAAVRAAWTELRKPARVLLVLDVSGSMGQAAGGGGSRLELAQSAAINGLTQLSDADEVGLWTFPNGTGTFYQQLPIAPLGPQRQAMTDRIRQLIPTGGTPLYSVTRKALDAMETGLAEGKINAVVVMTDGQNEDPQDNDLDSLVHELNQQSLEGGVRVFTIAYGEDADLTTAKAISEASRAAAYDATDPLTIDSVFTNVLSNF